MSLLSRIALALSVSTGLYCLAPAGAAPAPCPEPQWRVDDAGVLREGTKVLHRLGFAYPYLLEDVLQPGEPQPVWERVAAFLRFRGHTYLRFAAGGVGADTWREVLAHPQRHQAALEKIFDLAEEACVPVVPTLFWSPDGFAAALDQPPESWRDPQSVTVRRAQQFAATVLDACAGNSAVAGWEFAVTASPSRLQSAMDGFVRLVREKDPGTLCWLTRQARWHPEEPHAVTGAGDLLGVAFDQPFPGNGDQYRRFGMTLDNYRKQARETGKPLFLSVSCNGNAAAGQSASPSFRTASAVLSLINLEGPAFTSLVDGFRSGHEPASSPDRIFVLPDLYHRRAPHHDPPHAVLLERGGWRGLLVDNEANYGMEGAGFTALTPPDHPYTSPFRSDYVGLNFEHVFNGVAEDEYRSSLAPRQGGGVLERRSAERAVLRWKAGAYKWPIDCELTYTLRGADSVDLSFSATPREPCYEQGYLAFMFASYMAHAIDTQIWIYGRRHETAASGWLASWFASGGAGPPAWYAHDDTLNNPPNVAHTGSRELPQQKGAHTHNLQARSDLTFELPLFYGLVDGDGGKTPRDDPMAFILMFDQDASIRFSVFKSMRDAQGKPEPGSVAWDWQYIIHDPEVDTRYTFDARCVYKPYRGREDVLATYRNWVASRQEERNSAVAAP